MSQILIISPILLLAIIALVGGADVYHGSGGSGSSGYDGMMASPSSGYGSGSSGSGYMGQGSSGYMGGSSGPYSHYRRRREIMAQQAKQQQAADPAQAKQQQAADPAQAKQQQADQTMDPAQPDQKQKQPKASEPEQQQQAQQQGQQQQQQAKFTPVRGPKQFSVNVADGIHGANQIRKEKWENGTQTGMYANPLGNKKYQVINYIADEKGFRVTSTKIVDESELLKGKLDGQTDKKAHIDIEQDGISNSYTVTPDQIAAKKPNQVRAEDGHQHSANDNSNGDADSGHMG